MHFVVVAACSGAGGDGGDPPTPVAPPGGGGGTTASAVAPATAGTTGFTVRHDASAMPDPSVFPVATAHAAESGTRLKARWYATSDGARQWAFNWFDSELNIECSFLIANDGKRRCVPTAQFGSIFYLDANCSQEILASLATTCSERERYTAVILTTNCESRYRITQSGEAIQPTEIYAKSGETCAVGALNPAFVYYRIGEDVPPSSFAEVQVVTEP